MEWVCVCVCAWERERELFISTVIRFQHLYQPQRVTSGQGQEAERERKREICLYVRDCAMEICVLVCVIAHVCVCVCVYCLQGLLCPGECDPCWMKRVHHLGQAHVNGSCFHFFFSMPFSYSSLPSPETRFNTLHWLASPSPLLSFVCICFV